MRRCGDCGLWKANNRVCPFFQEPMDADEAGCPKFQGELAQCQICGRGIVGKAILNYDTHTQAVHTVCGNCDNVLYTCRTCTCGKLCDFETNPVQLPKMVQQEIRQGNMIAVQTIRNPERVRETCQKNCKCFHADFGCLKQNGECLNWEVKYIDTMSV